ncbi:MerR family transcriptional regulator, partial [Propionibacterium sp.]|uniref:MerR family transcriptional regulator n=1 Tax=Propionibacterium sp. TaxID=1977903 RepID=UPI0039EB4478
LSLAHPLRRHQTPRPPGRSAVWAGAAPPRAKGRGRRYSPRDISRLRLIQHLSQQEGINLSGIRRIIELENEIAVMRERAQQMTEMIRQMTEMQEQVQRVFMAGSQGDVDFSRFRRHAPPPAIER